MLALGFSAFALFGGVLVLVGANQQALALSLSLDLSETGLLGACLSIGIGLGVLVAGPLVDRFPRRPLFLASTLVTTAALIGVDLEMSFSRALVHVALIGFGGGAYDTLLNAVTVERYGVDSSRPLSLLHAGACVGAVLSPPVIAWLGSGGDWTWSFRALGVTYLLLSCWVALVPLAPPAVRPHDAGGTLSQILVRSILALCVVGFAYVGVEGSLTLFAVPYATEGLSLDPVRGQTAISAFWLGLLAGRIALGLYPGPTGGFLLAAMGLGSAALLAAGVASGFAAIEVWILAIGVALGGVFPLMVSIAGQAAPHAPGSAVGLVMAFGALGGFVLPWLTGSIGDRAGAAMGVGSLAFFCAFIAVGALVTGRRPSAAR